MLDDISSIKIEVLWSKGIKKVPPVFPLLVKGRNLYRLRTYRQVNYYFKEINLWQGSNLIDL